MSPTNDHHLPLLEAVCRRGVLCNVRVRYWRGCKKLRPEDLGLDPGQVSDRLIQLGHKRLVPKQALQCFALIESRAHSLVEAASFTFLGGIARFVPNPRLTDLTDKLDALRDEFRQATLDFVAGYAGLREEAGKLAGEVLETLDRSSVIVHQRTLDRLTDFIGRFRSLNFAGDAQLERTLERFREELLTRSAEDYRNDRNAMVGLTGGLERLRESAVRLAGTDARDIVSRFGQMGGRRLAAVG